MTPDQAALPPTLVGPTWHRFLSPHYDDIALSCGGTVVLLARAGLAPEIGVVFGDEPDPSVALSPFAEELHRGWGLDAGEVIAGRRAEEAIAAAVLGASSTHLPFRDAIYRDRHYQNDAQLFGAVSPAEATLPAEIAAALGPDGPPKTRVRVYAPLGIGNHVDHQHGFAVGAALARAGWDVWFYEDLPYALNEGALDKRLTALQPASPVEPAATIAVEAAWDEKLTAILAYQSQLATIFRYVGAGSGRDEIDTVMRAYAVRVGGGLASERFWRLVR